MLAQACVYYDSGDEDQAIHISSLIANFCNDGAATSLLTKLGLKKVLTFNVPMKGVHIADVNASMILVTIKVGADNGYAPRLNLDKEDQASVSFHDWWKQSVVRKTYTGKDKPDFGNPENNDLNQFIVDNMLQFGHANGRSGLMKKIEKIKNCI